MQSRSAIRSVKDAVSHVDMDAVREQTRHGPDRWHDLSPNVGDSERKLSVLGGSAVGALALTRLNRVSGWLLLGVSAGLILRGTTGFCGLYKTLDVNTRK